MKVLITGATGLLGPYLMEAFKVDPENTVIGLARTNVDSFRCDLVDPGDVRVVMQWQPDLIIHAAAATNVDWCQTHPQDAYAANVTATKHLVQFMPSYAKIVYISSDMIYSGDGPHVVGGHTENPINIYGMTKYLGEFEAAKQPDHLIVRTNMYGLAKTTKVQSSLVDFLIGAFKSELPFNIFTDVMFSPLHTVTLSRLIKDMVIMNRTGTINLGSRTGLSKAKFALLMARNLGLSAAQALPVESIPGEHRAPRPKDMRTTTKELVPSVEDDLAEACRSWVS